MYTLSGFNSCHYLLVEIPFIIDINHKPLVIGSVVSLSQLVLLSHY